MPPRLLHEASSVRATATGTCHRYGDLPPRLNCTVHLVVNATPADPVAGVTFAETANCVPVLSPKLQGLPRPRLVAAEFECPYVGCWPSVRIVIVFAMPAGVWVFQTGAAQQSHSSCGQMHFQDMYTLCRGASSRGSGVVEPHDRAMVRVVRRRWDRGRGRLQVWR